MNYDQLIALRRQQPFRPFRITMTDGRSFEVVHPELMLVDFDDVTIGFPRKGSDKPYFFEHRTMVEMSEIKEIEFLETASSSASH